jgi:hypothetical protein
MTVKVIGDIVLNIEGAGFSAFSAEVGPHFDSRLGQGLPWKPRLYFEVYVDGGKSFAAHSGPMQLEDGPRLLVVSGYQLYDFTDSTAFCGRICHKVMYPEYTTYQASPHSRVLCSDCHVGSGASYLVKSKISGVPQIFHTLFNTYPRPITSPVENLRPARETCEQCHWPDKFEGDMLKIIAHQLHNGDGQTTNH